MKSNKSNGQLTAQINVGDHKKSGFDLSNNVLGTGKIGRIIPTRALHVMPGDTIKADSKVAVQFEPLAVPILANMDVKQEHFYVPYNVVWKNWDKFISGGEKMDYQGVVPNTSIQDMVFRIFYDFGIYWGFRNETLTGHLTTVPGQYFEDGMHGFIETVKMNIGSLGNDYQIKDILQYTEEILPNFLEFQYDEDDQAPYFIDPHKMDDFPGFPGGIDDLGLANEALFDFYLDTYGMRGNKYIEELKDWILAQMEIQPTYLPTEKGFRLLELMYELVRPFVGLGSNIDYLNMGRLTLAELLYCVISDLSDQVAHDITTPIIGCEDAGGANLAKYLNRNPLSILNLRANYNIWYNNYRDILLEADAYEPQDIDGITTDELFVLLVPRQRCWEKDAFTTALDNPGTGNVGVPVTRTGGAPMDIVKVNHLSLGDSVAEEGGLNDMEISEISFNGQSWRIPTAYLSGQNQLEESSASFQGFSLHALDAAQRAQKWIQKALYFGNRIADFYYLRFGVRFLDARLRLPELLTSSSELVKLDVIMNNTNITTEANGEVFRSIAGDRAAYASAYDNGNNFERYCEEHGVIMSYLTIMPQITYAYGINRDYSRLDQFDFAFAEFATLGMDAVYDTEISSTSINKGSEVFGYQGRYYDYKAKHSEEHGELLDTQDMYTFARKFNMFANKRPKLNYEFVHCFPSLDMFVVDSPLADYFRYDIRHSTAAERELPSQSIYV